MEQAQSTESLEDAVEAVKAILGRPPAGKNRKRLVVELPKNLHDRLRFAAMMKDTTIKDLVIGVVEPLVNDILSSDDGEKTHD